MSKYLVTGGCGFIGSHLSQELILRGHDVIIVDNLSTGHVENVPLGAHLVVGDILDAELMDGLMERVDGCFHLAAIASVQKSTEDWAGTHRVNATGSITVFNAARANKIPVVYASSAAVYGDNASIPLPENGVLRPITAYGVDKLASELHARVAGVIHSVPTAGFRFFNVYGPRQDPRSPYSGVISIFADRVSKGNEILIHGDGNQTRDFVYVKDVVQFLIAGLAKASINSQIYNVCTGRSTSIKQLANTIFSVAGKQVKVIFGNPRNGDIQTSIGDPAKARSHLGMCASTHLSEGLFNTYKYLVKDISDQAQLSSAAAAG